MKKNLNKLSVTSEIKYALSNDLFKRQLKESLKKFNSGSYGKTANYTREIDNYIESIIRNFTKLSEVIEAKIGTYNTIFGDIAILRYRNSKEEKTITQFLENIIFFEDIY